MFLNSAFPNYDESASQCIITPVIGFRHNSALRVHFLHSLGSIPASRPFYRRAQCQLNHNSVRILPGPHLTPGSRAAMWIKCLAEGQKYRATVEYSNLDSQRESRAVTPLYHGTSTLLRPPSGPATASRMELFPCKDFHHFTLNRESIQFKIYTWILYNRPCYRKTVWSDIQTFSPRGRSCLTYFMFWCFIAALHFPNFLYNHFFHSYWCVF